VDTSADQRADRPGFWQFAELFGLAGLAFAQPVLSALGASPETFVFRRASTPTIMLFAVVVVLVAPAFAFLTERAAGLILGKFHGLHLAWLGLFASMWFVQLLHSTADVGAVVAWTVALVLAGVLVRITTRSPLARTWMRYLAVAPVGFLALFLFGSASSAVIFGGDSVPDETGQFEGNDEAADVVMIVVDELPTKTLLAPNGDLDAERFPGLARLAADGTFYRNHTTVNDGTLLAVPALLTGRLPEERLAPTAASYPENLFSLFSETHRVHAEEYLSLCADVVCGRQDRPEAFGELLGDAWLIFTERIGPPDTGPAELAAHGFRNTGREQLDRFQTWVNEFDDADGADLHFMHVLSPHAPFQTLPSGDTYNDPEPLLGLEGDTEGRWCCEYIADLVQRRHVLATMALDAQLDRLWERLDDQGIYDDSLIVVVADHGVGHEADTTPRNFDADNAAAVAWAPLFIKPPASAGDSGRGETSDANALTIDVVPTIADQLGVEVPWAVDGVALNLPEGRDTADKPFLDWTDDVGNDTTSTISLPVDGLDRVLAAAGSRRSEDLDPALWPYLSGVHDDLFATPVQAVDDVDRSWEVELQEVRNGAPAGQRRVRQPLDQLGGQAELPLYVSGTLRVDGAPAADGTPFVVAVDGVVGATGETVTLSGQPGRIEALVAPQIFGALDEDHTFTVHPVVEGPAGRQLAAVAPD
jgi:hypothetical protein